MITSIGVLLTSLLAAPVPGEPIDNMVHPAGTITVPVGELGAVEHFGDGPVTLVLVPGAPFSGEIWQGFVERNRERYSMIAVTPAGYGDTEPPPVPKLTGPLNEWTDGLVDAVVAEVREEGCSDVVVVGHHLISDVYALLIAGALEDVTRGLVVVAGQGDGPIASRTVQPEQRPELVRKDWVERYRSVDLDTWKCNTFSASTLSLDPARGKDLFEQQLQVPLPTQIRYYLEYLTVDAARARQALDVPILVIDTTQPMELDSLPESVQQQLVEQFGSLEAAQGSVFSTAAWWTIQSRVPESNITLAEFPGAGCFPMEDQAAKFDETLVAFIDTLVDSANQTPDVASGSNDEPQNGE